ncbi:MAG TPA: hypothetical protein VK589_26175 [Chryseolinea sp.]|nr:hypothetical protein [Chryseolinea sp.]
MVVRYLLSICIVYGIFVPEVSAQLVYDWENRAENWEYRVKNIEFFIDRFNNQPEGSGSVHAANPKDTAECLAFMKERDYKLFSLFDLGKVDRKDAAVKQKINTFFREINSPYQPKFIRFEDLFWYAELNMSVQSGGQSKKLSCVMQVVNLGQGVQAWVIKSFHSSDLQIDERFRGNELYFPPSTNGTDFMGVRLSLNDPSWTNDKVAKLVGAPSKTLNQLVEGRVKIEAIGKITYHFLQLDGWIMTVNYVNRESKNSGWLLGLLQPANNQQKVQYLKELYAD